MSATPPIRFLFFCVGIGVVAGLGSVVAQSTQSNEMPGIRVVDTASRTAAAEETSSVSVLFVGDMLFDRTLRRPTPAAYDALFDNVRDVFLQHDVVIGNLEGPITAHDSVSVGTRPEEAGNTTFTFDPVVASVLKKNNLGVVSIGNNHIYDFGADGLKQTRDYLATAGIRFFGDPADGAKPLIVSQNGIDIALVNYNAFGDGTYPDTVQAIANVSGADAAIVYAHWGEEYTPEPTDEVVRIARSFVDAGANVVIGSHPHVVQPSERYKNGVIYYSLGNFIFDQYWDETVRRGLAVGVRVRENGDIALTEYNVDIAREGPRLERRDNALLQYGGVE